MDTLYGILSDAIALVGRILLLAPPEQQRILARHALREINEMIDTILNSDEPQH
jgi:hypothetical protein